MSGATLPILPLVLQAGRVPDKVAMVDDRPDGTGAIWTFAELNRQANRLAHVLRDLGVEAGDKVVWCGPNSPGVVRAMHARAKIGFTAVPLNYRLAPEEAAYIVDDSDAVVAYPPPGVTLVSQAGVHSRKLPLRGTP